jgi:hypothetical protein
LVAWPYPGRARAFSSLGPLEEAPLSSLLTLRARMSARLPR